MFRVSKPLGSQNIVIHDHEITHKPSYVPLIIIISAPGTGAHDRVLLRVMKAFHLLRLTYLMLKLYMWILLWGA